MILHHVPQRADLVVVPGPGLEPHRLRDRDLDMVDVALRPGALEERVGEAQDKEVLNRLLPQIMVDSIGPALGQGFRQGVVDLASRRRGRVPSGFSMTSRSSPSRSPAAFNARGCPIRRGQAGSPCSRRARGRSSGPSASPIRRTESASLTSPATKESWRSMASISATGDAALAQTIADLLLEGVSGPGPHEAENAAVRRDDALRDAARQGGQQLAHGEIAGGAHEDQVEGAEPACVPGAMAGSQRHVGISYVLNHRDGGDPGFIDGFPVRHACLR